MTRVQVIARAIRNLRCDQQHRRKPGQVAGCGGGSVLSPAPSPRTVEVAITAAPELNPNVEGRPSPVVLRLFVLKDSGAFSVAPLDALSASATETLGEALLAQERRLIRPGESLQLPLKIDPEAGYIGAVAEFRDALGSQSRSVMAAPEKKLLDLLSKKSLRVELTGNAVNVRAAE